MKKSWLVRWNKRKSYSGKQYDQKDYNEFSVKVREYDDKEFSDFSQLIAGGLMHGNEYRLGKRLKELINCLDIDTKTYLFGNSSNRATFIQSTVDTRDYLTHYDRRHSAKIFYNNHLFYSSIVLKAVFAIIIYRDLGLKKMLF